MKELVPFWLSFFIPIDNLSPEDAFLMCFSFFFPNTKDETAHECHSNNKDAKEKHGLRGRKLRWVNHISLNSWINLEIFTAMLKSCDFIRSCVQKKNLGLCKTKVILPLHFFPHVVRPQLLLFFCETKQDMDTESWRKMKENPEILEFKNTT